MLALWILLGILLFFCTLGCIPVRVTAIYDSCGAKIYARLGPIKVKLYPRTDLNASRLEPEKTAEKTDSQPVQDKAQSEHPIGGKLELFRELLALVLEAQGRIRNRLWIRELVLYLSVAGKGNDPAKAAVLYGGAWSAVGVLWPQLERAFQIKSRDVQVKVDFLSEETTVYAKATAAIFIGTILHMFGYFGIRGLKLYRKHKKKGGEIYGTSNQ